MTVFQSVADIEERNQAGALCLIVRSQGSTPRHTSCKMLVYPDGRIVGTVGGGELENRVIKEIIPMREATYSPDGFWLAYESWPDGLNHAIYVMTSNGLARQLLTSDSAFEFDPVWRPRPGQP